MFFSPNGRNGVVTAENGKLQVSEDETASLYLSLCAVFGKEAIFPYHDFKQMSYAEVLALIDLRQKLNIERMKAEQKAAEEIQRKGKK